MHQRVPYGDPEPWCARCLHPPLPSPPDGQGIAATLPSVGPGTGSGGQELGARWLADQGRDLGHGLGLHPPHACPHAWKAQGRLRGRSGERASF